MLDSVGAKVWSIGAAFLTISSFISGFALSNGINQQEHKLINHRVMVLEQERAVSRKKFELINNKLDELLVHKKVNTSKTAYIEEF